MINYNDPNIIHNHAPEEPCIPTSEPRFEAGSDEEFNYYYDLEEA